MPDNHPSTHPIGKATGNVAVAAPAIDPWLGQTLGHYRLTRLVGHGRLGSFYEAQDTLEPRSVGVRLLPEALAARPQWPRTLETTRRLPSSNLVAILEAGDSDGTPYLIVDFIKGGTTAGFVKTFGPFDWPEATRIAADACRGLMAAHAAGLVHGNIKPGNILLANDGGVRLADLGLANLADAAPPGDFSSPERLRDGTASQTGDIYSLGLCYYTFLTGKTPAPPAQRRAGLQPCLDNPDVPPSCGAVVRRATDDDPAQRYSSAGDMLNDLEAALDLTGAVTMLSTTRRTNHSFRLQVAPPPLNATPTPAISDEVARLLAPPKQKGELGWLGSYRVLRVLGEGGMGTVFQAEDTSLERMVALKVLKPDRTAGDVARQRFLQEAKAAASLQHEHIVTIYQVGEDRGLPFLAMELLQGESLDELLKRNDGLDLAEVVRIGTEIAKGLEAAHARGLIHRDVKPANIFLSGAREAGAEAKKGRFAPGKVKLLDFGLARSVTGTAMHLTRTGMILGTPGYMAPEQARGTQTLDGRCDLFGLGCVLYHMCCGQSPFRRDDAMATLIALATEEPTAVRVLNPDVPVALANLIMALLAKDPAGRPASARAVVDTLSGIGNKPAGKRRLAQYRLEANGLSTWNDRPGPDALSETRTDLKPPRREATPDQCPGCGAPAGNSLALGWCLKCGYVSKDLGPLSKTGQEPPPPPAPTDLNWLWGLLAGCFVVMLGSVLAAAAMPKPSKLWTTWCVLEIVLGLLAIVGAHLWAFILVLPRRSDQVAMQYLDPLELWRHSYDAWPQTVGPLWLASWGATGLLCGLTLFSTLSEAETHAEREPGPVVERPPPVGLPPEPVVRPRLPEARSAAIRRYADAREARRPIETEIAPRGALPAERRFSTVCHVIGYIRDEEKRLSALVLGYKREGRWHYAATVAADASFLSDKLVRRLASLELTQSVVGGLQLTGVAWVKPDVVCRDVDYAEIDAAGRLREARIKEMDP